MHEEYNVNCNVCPLNGAHVKGILNCVLKFSVAFSAQHNTDQKDFLEVYHQCSHCVLILQMFSVISAAISRRYTKHF